MKRFLLLFAVLCVFPLLTSASVFFVDSDIQSDSAGLGFNKTSGYNINFGNGDLIVSRSNGYVGIGTTTPAYALHVVGSATFSTSTGAGSPVSAGQAATKGYVDSILGGGVGAGTVNQTLRNNGTGWVASSLLTNIGTHVGIGVSPSFRLDVYNAAPPGNVISYFQSGSASGLLKLVSTGASWNFGSTASGLQFYNNDTSQTRMTITNAGSVGIGTATPGAMLDIQGSGNFSTVSAAVPTSVGHAATKGYVDSLIASTWIQGASNSLYSGNSGNVGIGIATPATKLEVAGKVRATGIQIGSSTTAGYALTADANGVGTWQALPGTTGSKPGGSSFTLHSPVPASQYKTFTWNIMTSYSPASYVTCPTGYTLWWDSNAIWYTNEAGHQAYNGACYATSATNDVFAWKSASPSSVTCPSGYTKWYISQNAYGIYSSQSFYSGVCYKGTPTSFDWEIYQSYSPDTYVTCPSGYTRWWNSYAKWYGSTSGYYNYTGSCISNTATTDVFKWKSEWNTGSSVTCPSGYTKWYITTYQTYGPNGMTYQTGVCYKGTPGSFGWELGSGANPSGISCPSGYTNWYDTTNSYYYSYSSNYAYVGACVNTSVGAADSFTLLPHSSSAASSISCPSGYSKYTNGQFTYQRGWSSSYQTWDTACYKPYTPAGGCQSCPAGFTSGSCSTVANPSGDINEQICYKQGGPIQSIQLLKKGSNQSLSCPSNWSTAGIAANVEGNTELMCYMEYCTASYTTPAPPSSLSASVGGILTASLSWSGVGGGCSGATSYNVYRSTTSGSGFSQIASGVTLASYSDSSGLVNGTTYYYKVSSVNPSGESTLSNESSMVAASANPPSAPQNLVATPASTQASLSWVTPSSNGGSAITGYKVFRDTTAGATTLVQTLGVTTTWTNTGLTNGTKYYFRVKATNSAGDGEYSNEASSTPQSTWLVGTYNGTDIYVSKTCASGAWDCQAKAACEGATGATCVWQSYACSGYPSGNGSYYPTSDPLGKGFPTSGSSNFNFAVSSAWTTGGNTTSGYGNLCACYNSGTNWAKDSHTYCGSGRFETY